MITARYIRKIHPGDPDTVQVKVLRTRRPLKAPDNGADDVSDDDFHAEVEQSKQV